MRKTFKDFPLEHKLKAMVEFFDPQRITGRALRKLLLTHGYEPNKDNIKRVQKAMETLVNDRSKKSTKLYEWKKKMDANYAFQRSRNLVGVLPTRPMEERLRRRQANRERDICNALPHCNSITLKTSPDSIGVERTSGRYYTLTVGPDWRTDVYNKGMAVTERNFMLMAEHITTHDDGIEIYRVLYWRPTSEGSDEIQKGWAARLDWSEGRNKDAVCCYGKTATTVYSNMQRKLGKKAGQILTRGLDENDV